MSGASRRTCPAEAGAAPHPSSVRGWGLRSRPAALRAGLGYPRPAGELGWSQRQLAEHAGMTQPGIARSGACGFGGSDIRSGYSRRGLTPRNDLGRWV
jgi:hypothetical protein